MVKVYSLIPQYGASKMLVSVVVPVYKVEPYLENCVKSILNQTFKEFELILVDDGSPDNCGKICDDFARKDSRIKVIHQRNGGLSNARNSGIEIAKGDYITFIDSDDFILSRYLEKLVEASLTNGSDISVCAYFRCNEKDSLSDIEEKNKNTIEVFSDEKMLIFFATKKIGTTAWGKLYKMRLFEKLRYPDGKYNEDVFTTYLAIHNANRIAVCSYEGYVYRINEKSIMNEAFSIKKLDAIEGCVKRAEFISQKYPDLIGFANSSVVYSCNLVLISMAKSGISEHECLKNIQFLLRNNLKYYLFSDVSFLGKAFAVVASINVKCAIFFMSRLKTLF